MLKSWFAIPGIWTFWRILVISAVFTRIKKFRSYPSSKQAYEAILNWRYEEKSRFEPFVEGQNGR